MDHHYRLSVQWTGDRGTGTSGYRAYGRQHTITAPGKPPLAGSADRTFHGDADRWNPEELLIAALSQCHLLSYLHVAVRHGVVVTGYRDEAAGTMTQTAEGGGRFTSVSLHPAVEVADPDQVELAQRLHAEAGSLCFIAASVNFPVHHEPTTTARSAADG